MTMRCYPHESVMFPPTDRPDCLRLTYGRASWMDRHGDVWRLSDDGLMHTQETRPFPPSHVEKKWGPLRPVTMKETDDAN